MIDISQPAIAFLQTIAKDGIIHLDGRESPNEVGEDTPILVAQWNETILPGYICFNNFIAVHPDLISALRGWKIDCEKVFGREFKRLVIKK